MGRRGKSSAVTKGLAASTPDNASAQATSRTQQKKAARVQLAAAAIEKQKKLDAATAVNDVTTLLPEALKTLKKNGIDATVSGFNASDAPPTLLEAAFALCRDNMRGLYEKTQFNDRGWDDKAKWREMTHEDARFVFATSSEDGELVGFAHFRFESDEETCEEILYLYEVQLCKDARRKGVGRYFMALLEIVARALGMKKIVCTVLKDNTEAYRFFKTKLGYQLDPSSPEYIPAVHGAQSNTTATSLSTELATCGPGRTRRGSDDEDEAGEARRVLHQLMVEDDDCGQEDYNLCAYEILSKVMKPLSVLTNTSAPPLVAGSRDTTSAGSSTTSTSASPPSNTASSNDK